MPGSPTTQDRSGTRVVAPVRFAFRIRNHVGVLDEKYFVAQWHYDIGDQRIGDFTPSGLQGLRSELIIDSRTGTT
jgi:hypothetical protein